MLADNLDVWGARKEKANWTYINEKINFKIPERIKGWKINLLGLEVIVVKNMYF